MLVESELYLVFANTNTNKPANFDSGGCSGTWLRALIAEALPSITSAKVSKINEISK